MTALEVPGYGYGDPASAPSPVTADDLAQLLASAAFGEADALALQTAGEVLADQTDDVLDVWYGFVGSQPHLLAYFSTPDGQPLPEYLSRVRARFARWILDTCTRPYDQAWLDYQNEMALRHTSAGKNRTDGAPSVLHIHLRHVIAFIAPVTLTIRPFLASRGHSAAEVDAMHQAWLKSVTVQIALWSQAYARDVW